MSCHERLTDIVPVSTSSKQNITHVTTITLQAAPTIASIFLWIVFELRTRPPVPRVVRNGARSLALLCVVAITLLTWRVVELLECSDAANTNSSETNDGTASTIDIFSWPYDLIVCGCVFASGVVLVGASILGRWRILITMVLASTTVVLDAGLRGWWVDTHTAARPLMAIQQLWNTIGALLYLASHIGRTQSASVQPFVVRESIDPLTTTRRNGSSSQKRQITQQP